MKNHEIKNFPIHGAKTFSSNYAFFRAIDTCSQRRDRFIFLWPLQPPSSQGLPAFPLPMSSLLLLFYLQHLRQGVNLFLPQSYFQGNTGKKKSPSKELSTTEPQNALEPEGKTVISIAGILCANSQPRIHKPILPSVSTSPTYPSTNSTSLFASDTSLLLNHFELYMLVIKVN